MFNQMKQMYEMQKKFKELQRQMEAIKVEKNNFSKTLTINANGAQRLENITIDTGYFNPEKKSDLEKSLVKLINDALEDAQKQGAMQAATQMKDFKGLNIPGLRFKKDAMDIRELLEFMVRQNISDIHFKAHCAPLIRLHGRLITTAQDAFSPELIKTLAYILMDDRLKKKFEEEGELDMAYALQDVGRFRVNAYRQKGTIALSLRVIPLELKSFAELHLPAATLEKLCAFPSGLILIAGVTGAGKTTTLNAMVHYLNERYAYNIITIEDPIEFYHADKKSSVSQREVGQDTRSFSAALKHILRQDPDVIVIGEMRDPETIAAAVTAAETGHLVLSTIHTSDAVHTIQRIVDSYPAEYHQRIQSALANVLRGIIAQKLVTTVKEDGRLPCSEAMVVNSYIRQLISEGKSSEMNSVMARDHNDGMGTFDQDLLRLYKDGLISKETALIEATRPDNFLSLAQGISVHV